MSTTPARIAPTVSLTANFPPPIGWMSNNGAHESSVAKAIIWQIACSCQAWGSIPKTLCIASVATEVPEGVVSRSEAWVGCCADSMTLTTRQKGRCQ
jgi:hypothetical protein